MRLVPFALALAACAPSPTDSPDDTGTTDSGGGGDSDSARVDDADTPETATPLEYDAEFEGSLHGDDVDWFSLTGRAGQQFRIQVVNEDEGLADDALDTVVEVFDAEGTRIAWEDAHPIGDVATYDTVCFGFFPADGQYFFKVEDRATFDGGTADVATTTYTVTALSPSSVPEEDDSLLSVGKSVTIDKDNSWFAIPVASETPGDVDYLKLTFPHADGAFYVAAAEHIESSPYAPALEVYNGDGTKVMDAPTLRPADGRSFIALPDTTYILAVRDASGSTGAGDGAWLFVASAEAGTGNPREVEPNDTLGAANALPLADQKPDAGSWYAGFAEGRVGSDTDEDWYAFVTPEDAWLKVAFGAASYGSLLQADVEVVDTEGNVVAQANTSGGVDPEAASSAKVPAGNYWLRVRALPGTPTGEGAYYRLALHATSVPL